MIKTLYCIIALCLSSVVNICAQNDRQLIRQGNRLFRSQEYEKAEAAYRKAIAANSNNPEAHYNLGCALMAQQKDSAAVNALENSAKLQQDRNRRAQAFHNIGVICQQKKMFSEAAKAYKESLRNNPKDDETRYNLALCMKQIKNQPKQQQQQQKKQQDKNNKNNKQDKEKNKNENNKDQQKQKQQDEKMSKDNAEQLLNAAMQQEKATQQKLKKAQNQPRNSNHLKNW